MKVLQSIQNIQMLVFTHSASAKQSLVEKFRLTLILAGGDEFDTESD